MPITKVPIVHKFGIISHTQRLELQERLLKQSYLQTLKSQKVIVPTRNPLEVSEDFVNEYNNAKDFTEKEKLEETAQKMLERAKRRAGVRDGGTGNHVKLPMAWTELAQLAQCRGKIQEECLDVLIVSLDQSPLGKYHIPALFFLAETMLYWLRTDAVHQPYLRTGEIKLLRMGQLVFSRLFYHHMAGQLSGQKDFKNRLFTYLDGLQECQEAYSPYPNALLSLRFIITVGKIIMSDTQLEPGEIKEGDNVRKSALSRPSARSTDTGKRTNTSKDLSSHTPHSVAISSSVHDLSPTLWHALDVWRCTNHLSGGLSEALKALSQCGMGLVNESWVDSMIALQILAEAAKSSLLALRTLHNLARGFRPRDDVKSTPSTSRSESTEQKLKPSSSVSSATSRREHKPVPWSKAISESYSFSSDETSSKDQESRASVASSKPTLSDIFERSEEGDSEKNKNNPGTGSSKSSPDESEENGSPVTMTTNQYEDSPSYEGSPLKNTRSPTKKTPSPTKSPVKKESEDKLDNEEAGAELGSLKREVSFDKAVLSKDNKEKDSPQKTPKSTSGTRVMTQGSRTTVRTGESMYPPGTGYEAEAGTTLPSGRASEASTVQTYTNTANTELPGINGWHWEVAITYTDILADICLHGNTAEIQKMALMGTNRDVADPFKRGYNNLPLPSAGLLDLAFFKAMNEQKDGGPNDWSWRIRFGAVQSMVKICRTLTNDKSREGLRTAAWNVLLRAHSMEKDERVLEALKVGQVHTDIESFLNKQLVANPFTLGSKVAAGLSQIYLPPLPPPVDPYIPPKRRDTQTVESPLKATTTSQESLPKSQEKMPARTSLKEEIMLATALYEPPVSFNTRTSFDLRRIVEDQWRKDLQKQMEEEEMERKKALEAQQKEEEAFQKQLEEKHKQKFSKSKKEKDSVNNKIIKN